MKKPIFIMALGMIIIILLSSVVFASGETQFINAFFNNIGIIINGEKFTPKDVNNNEVEPFIYEGTTYLPVRAIANAFNKDVNWDAEHSTVVLLSKKEIYLDSISYYNRVEPGGYGYFKSYSNNDISHGLEFYQQKFDERGETVECSQTISYKIDKKYKLFKTTVSGVRYGGKLNIYGDNNKLLYSTPKIEGFQDNTKLNIEIDISNENTLHIEFVTDDGGIILNEAKLIK